MNSLLHVCFRNFKTAAYLVNWLRDHVGQRGPMAFTQCCRMRVIDAFETTRRYCTMPQPPPNVDCITTKQASAPTPPDSDSVAHSLQLMVIPAADGEGFCVCVLRCCFRRRERKFAVRKTEDASGSLSTVIIIIIIIITVSRSSIFLVLTCQ